MGLDMCFLAGGKMIVDSELEDEREESAYAQHNGTVHE